MRCGVLSLQANSETDEARAHPTFDRSKRESASFRYRCAAIPFGILLSSSATSSAPFDSGAHLGAECIRIILSSSPE
jgi:hypothetical protein